MLESIFGGCSGPLVGVVGILLVILLTRIWETQPTFPGPRYLLGIGPWLSYFRFLRHGIPETTNYYNYKYGDLVRVWVAGTPTLLVTRPSTANYIMKTRGYNYCRRLGNDEGLRHIGMYENGIIWNNNLPLWKKFRGFLQKALNAETLERAVPVAVASTQRMMAKIPELRMRTSDGRIEAMDFFRRTLLEVSNQLMIKVTIDNDEEFVRTVGRYFTAMEYFLIRPTAMYSGKTGYHRHVQSVKDLQEAVGCLLDKKVVSMSTEGFDRDNLNFTESLLTAKEETDSSITMDNIRQSLLEMLLAGSDSSAVTVYYFLVYLAEQNDVQDKIFQEIMDVIGDNEVMQQDVPQLEYMENALKESMRLKPAGPLIMRKAIKDDVINGIPVPAVSNVLINLALMHKRPESFENPDRFDPHAHFAEKNLTHEFVPFGAGPKSCIGHFLAMVQMKTVLATFLREYSVKSVGVTLDNIETRWNIAQQPSNPSYLFFVPRTRNS